MSIGLEGTFKDHLVLPPAVGRNIFSLYQVAQSLMLILCFYTGGTWGENVCPFWAEGAVHRECQMKLGQKTEHLYVAITCVKKN